MPSPGKHRKYWRKNLRVTAILLSVWFSVTFLIAYYARGLSEITILGFPVPFYMGAQGSLIVYVLIVWYYVHRMNQIDKEFAEDSDSEKSQMPGSTDSAEHSN